MFSACEVYDCDNLESDSKKRPGEKPESPSRSFFAGRPHRHHRVEDEPKWVQ